MSRRRKDPLRALDDAERVALSRLSRSGSAPAAQVARARALLAVADGQSYTAAARLVGRRTGDTVARWVAGFNRDGPAALVPGHGGGHRVRYGAVEQRRILAEVARPPDRARDGTATWSLSTLRAALRRADDGLPGIGTHTIGRALHAAGFRWRKSRTWCETGVVETGVVETGVVETGVVETGVVETGVVVRKRKRDGIVAVSDPDAAAKRG